VYAKLPLTVLLLACSHFAIALPVAVTAIFSVICLPDVPVLGSGWLSLRRVFAPRAPAAEQSGCARCGSWRPVSGTWEVNSEKTKTLKESLSPGNCFLDLGLTIRAPELVIKYGADCWFITSFFSHLISFLKKDGTLPLAFNEVTLS